MAKYYDIHDIFDQDTTQDGISKMLFTHKQIVAWILRECFPEFKGCPLDFIIGNCLDCLDDVDYLIGIRHMEEVARIWISASMCVFHKT